MRERYRETEKRTETAIINRHPLNFAIESFRAMIHSGIYCEFIGIVVKMIVRKEYYSFCTYNFIITVADC